MKGILTIAFVLFIVLQTLTQIGAYSALWNYLINNHNNGDYSFLRDLGTVTVIFFLLLNIMFTAYLYISFATEMKTVINTAFPI